MTRLLWKVAVALALIVVILVIVVWTRPSEFRVARSATIAAPPNAVFAQVNAFHNWPAWNPWATLDPAMKETYEGPTAGPGAVYTWAGNNNVGTGRMTLVESRPSERIRITLEFFRPFAATNTAEVTFRPEGNGTLVTWTMSGRNTFMAKAMCLVVNMDRMVGGQFEKGLAQMKSVVESAPARHAVARRGGE
jgi:uncharacterized protein YndB with AHSA1/START domain